MSDPMVGASTAVFGVHLSVAVPETVTVQWETLNGTAIAGVDYEAANGAVVFAPGETEKLIEVVVYGADVSATSGKNFYIKLHPPSNAILFTAFADCMISVVDDGGVAVTKVVVAQGKRGLKGDPGLSAYEQAVIMGYPGTLEDWMNEIADASQAAARAETAANTATTQGDRATTEANRAKTEADRAKTEADRAAAAADAAEHAEIFDDRVKTENSRTQRAKNNDIISSKDANTPNEAAHLAYSKGAKFLALTDTKMVVNTSHDIRAIMQWAQNVTTANGAVFTLALANGFYDSSYYLNITGNLRLESEGRATLVKATNYTYTLVSGSVYDVLVNCLNPVPAHVVVGFAIGIQNPQGDNSADACAGAHIVKWISADRMSFSFEMRSYGPAPVNPTALDNTLTYGLVPNSVVFPPACFNTLTAGWDGAAIEGFLNVLKGGSLTLSNIGFAHAGPVSERDIIFVHGNDSSVSLEDFVVIAGAGDKVMRAAYGGKFYAYRSCLGAWTNGQEIYQGVHDCSLSLIRCSISGGTASALTATMDTQISMTQCIVMSCATGLRTTYKSASIQCVTSTIGQCNIAVQPSSGTLQLANDVKVKRCNSLASISSGRMSGNPTLTDVTTVPVNNQFVPQGGYWEKDLAPITYKTDQFVGIFTALLDFPSIPAGSHADLTVTAAGVIFNDIVNYCRAGAAEPNQPIMYQAYVSAADTITLRAFNISAAAIDKTAFTARFAVYRAA